MRIEIDMWVYLIAWITFLGIDSNGFVRGLYIAFVMSVFAFVPKIAEGFKGFVQNKPDLYASFCEASTDFWSEVADCADGQIAFVV